MPPDDAPISVAAIVSSDPGVPESCELSANPRSVYRVVTGFGLMRRKNHHTPSHSTAIENAPQAFMGLFDGKNDGKMLVQLADDPTKA